MALGTLLAVAVALQSACSDDSPTATESGSNADTGQDVAADGTNGSDGAVDGATAADGTSGDDADGADAVEVIEDTAQDVPPGDVGGDVSDPEFPPACSGCHGDSTSPAPPPDTTGRTETTAQTVGAHRSHLGASDWHATVLCSDCHQVPETTGAEGHLDGPPADLTFSRTAVAGGATPDYVADGGCGNVYCHGATLDAGGTNTDPDWVTVDGTQAACGNCHNTGSNAALLGGRHSRHLRQGLDCADCHTTLNGSGDIVRPAQHIDGVVEFEPSGSDLVFDGARCNGACHGEQHRNISW